MAKASNQLGLYSCRAEPCQCHCWYSFCDRRASLLRTADKVKQKEAPTLLASYVKAAQAYFTENSGWLTTSSYLQHSVAVTGCANSVATICKTVAPANCSGTSAAGNCFSTSGLYKIRWVPGQASTFTEVPAGTFTSSG